MITANMTVRIPIDPKGERPEVESNLDSLMESLVGLVEASDMFSDLGMGADLVEMEVAISLTASGDTQDQAVNSILELIRTAIKNSSGDYEIEIESNRVVVNRISALS